MKTYPAETPGRCSALMIQGTGSGVGKTLLTAGLCRFFANQGLKVRPFKPQNMSNNAAIARDQDGVCGEIGRGQALQARAARTPPSVDMNPILLKPIDDRTSQIIVAGHIGGTTRDHPWKAWKAEVWPQVLASYKILRSQADLILVEGAGSASEINLRDGDIANMGFAAAAGLPVILCADIERGGVFANLIGTHQVLSPGDRSRVGGYIINRFRGHPDIFSEGPPWISRQTGWPCFGIVPHFPAAANLPEEDAYGVLSDSTRSAQPPSRVPGQVPATKICVPLIPGIANFDDFDPLAIEPGCQLTFVRPGRPIPSCDWIILPGSKAVIQDLEQVRKTNWDIDILAHVRQGRPVLGICGGYQMLGQEIHDPMGVEGQAHRTCRGLGLLSVTTTLGQKKELSEQTAVFISSEIRVNAYEIHSGCTIGSDTRRPLFRLESEEEWDGAQTQTGYGGWIGGTYLHGIFANDSFRRGFFSASLSTLRFEDSVDQTLDAWAEKLAAVLDTDSLLKLAHAAGNFP